MRRRASHCQLQAQARTAIQVVHRQRRQVAVVAAQVVRHHRQAVVVQVVHRQAVAFQVHLKKLHLMFITDWVPQVLYKTILVIQKLLSIV